MLSEICGMSKVLAKAYLTCFDPKSSLFFDDSVSVLGQTIDQLETKN